MYISDQKSLAWKKSLEVVYIYVSMNSKRYKVLKIQNATYVNK